MRDLLRRTAIAAVAAVVVNTVVRAIAIALFNLPDDFEHIELRAVIVSTLVGVVAAALVYAVIRRDRTFIAVAAIALVLSFAAPASLGFEVGAAVATLMFMHVTTAAIVVAAFTSGRRRGT